MEIHKNLNLSEKECASRIYKTQQESILTACLKARKELETDLSKACREYIRKLLEKM